MLIADIYCHLHYRMILDRMGPPYSVDERVCFGSDVMGCLRYEVAESKILIVSQVR